VSSMQQSAAIARQNMKVRAVLDVFL